MGLIQHLFVAVCHLETNRLMLDMLLPMAAFQFSISRRSVVMLNRPTQTKTLMLTQRLMGSTILVCCGTTFMSETSSVSQTWVLHGLIVSGGCHLILYHGAMVMNTRESFSDVTTSTPYDKRGGFCVIKAPNTETDIAADTHSQFLPDFLHHRHSESSMHLIIEHLKSSKALSLLLSTCLK